MHLTFNIIRVSFSGLLFFLSYLPASDYKMAATAPNISSKHKEEGKAVGPAISSSFLSNRISISRTSSRFPYPSLCPDWCHVATSSCKGDLFRQVPLPALERRKSRMDIDNVCNTCLSCYSVNTSKARTMIHQALPPYYATCCSFPGTLLDRERAEMGRAWGAESSPCVLSTFFVCWFLWAALGMWELLDTC